MNVVDNIIRSESEKMTLRRYYRNLPRPTSPKMDFVGEIARKCGVTLTTARNWAVYGFRPKDPKHLEVLSEITGIPVKDLFED